MTKDYKQTRKEIEELVNNKVIPNLVAKEKELDENTINCINITQFLYSVGRMSALESLVKLVVIDLLGSITKEQQVQIENYFKD